MRNQLVRPSLRHRDGFVRVENVGRSEQVKFMRHSDCLDLLIVTHTCGFKVSPEGTIDEANSWEVLYS